MALWLIPSSGAAYDFVALDDHLDHNGTVWTTFGQPRLYLEIRRDGETIHTYSRGGIDADSRLPIASATKWISGAVVLALAERGDFDLDQPISTVLPAFDRPGKASVTPTHGFTMRDGMLTGGGVPMYPTDRSYDLQTSVQLIAEEAPTLFIPGTGFNYGGAGMQAVGAMMEIIFHQTWEELARETILDPLHMPTTSYTFFAPNPAIGGGIETTATEYLRFLDMIMNEGWVGDTQLLSPESLDLMFTDYTSGLPGYFIPLGEDLGLPDGRTRGEYAFGTWILRDFESGGVRTATSPGAFGTFPFVDRELGTYGIFITAVPDAKPTWPVILEAMDLIEEAVAEHDAAARSTVWMIH